MFCRGFQGSGYISKNGARIWGIGLEHSRLLCRRRQILFVFSSAGKKKSCLIRRHTVRLGCPLMLQLSRRHLLQRCRRLMLLQASHQPPSSHFVTCDKEVLKMSYDPNTSMCRSLSVKDAFTAAASGAGLSLTSTFALAAC